MIEKLWGSLRFYYLWHIHERRSEVPIILNTPSSFVIIGYENRSTIGGKAFLSN